MIRQAVLDKWQLFSEDLEGRCYHLYLDSKGLMTTGVGNLVDTFVEVAALPWKRPDGSRASREEVAAAYASVRAKTDWALIGGNNRLWRSLTSIRLSPEDVDALVRRKLNSNHAILEKRFPEIGDWPADAELFLHSWAWAVGANGHFPLMNEALRLKDFGAAMLECTITHDGKKAYGTLVTRNERNRVLLRNASRVQAFHFDPEVVYWPDDLSALVKEAETLSELPEAPSTEDDGGAARRAATLDTVEHPFDGENDENESSPKTS